MDFDFDEWAQLAKADPVGFDERRRAALRMIIKQSPAKHRRKLQGTLFRIEATNAKGKSPLHRAILASQLMWVAFEELRARLNEISGDAKKGAILSSKNPNAEGQTKLAIIVKLAYLSPHERE
jgi:hypothetical protein